MIHQLRAKRVNEAVFPDLSGELLGLQIQLPKIKAFPKVKAFPKSTEVSPAFAKPSLIYTDREGGHSSGFSHDVVLGRSLNLPLPSQLGITKMDNYGNLGTPKPTADCHG